MGQTSESRIILKSTVVFVEAQRSDDFHTVDVMCFFAPVQLPSMKARCNTHMLAVTLACRDSRDRLDPGDMEGALTDSLTHSAS